jgi:hypothetical protein
MITRRVTAGDACPLHRRNFAARNGRPNPGEPRPDILERPQRRQVDRETLRRIDGAQRRRQELRGERAQQIRLAVEEVRQRLRAQRAGEEIRGAPLGIGNAGRPAARVAGASSGEPPARVARARR